MSGGRKRRKHTVGERKAMSVPQAYGLLGLSTAADRELVHSTYRRLALEHHPDRNPGDVTSLGRFKELAAAYRVLQSKFHLEESHVGEEHGECDRCGQYDLLRTAQDGSQCCADCLSLATRRRLLPAPPVVIVTCATTIVLLVLAIACMLAGWWSRGPGYSAISLVLGVAALLSLAITCLTVIYTADARQLQRGRSPRMRSNPK